MSPRTSQSWKWALSALLASSVSATSQEPLGEGGKGSGPFDLKFEKLVNMTLEHWKVPGLSIDDEAVVEGKDTWARGYGMATLPSTPAEASTLYCVGSTTKAFTAAAMSILVDDNDNYSHVQWDTPISRIIRDDFVLEDDYVTAHATIEDALSHRTGMPRHDLSYGGQYEGHQMTAKDVVRSLRYLPLTAEPRTKWQYCNMMYVVISHVIETLTGSFLGDVIRDRILEPLNMRSTYFSTTAARKSPDHFAQGYYYHNGSYHEVPDMDLTQASGAGFIVSNVLDYTKWIRAMINVAPPISEAGHKALRAPRTLHTDESYELPYTGALSYSLGWEVGVYKGYEFWQHSGGMEAFGADVIFFPTLELGLIAFGNIAGRSNFAEEVLIWHIIDEKLGIPKEERFDWNKRNQAGVDEQAEFLRSAKSILFPSLPSPPVPLSLPLTAYVGTYSHPAYHNMVVGLLSSPSSSGPYSGSEKHRLHIDRSDQTWKMFIDLEHVSGEHFIAWAESITAPKAIFEQATRAEFRLGPDGTVVQFGVSLEAMMGDEKIWFTRV